MNNIKPFSIGAIATASVLASLGIYHQTHAKFLEANGSLLKQADHLAQLTMLNQHLSNAVVQVRTRPADDRAAELVRLRVEAQVLRKHINELEQQQAEAHPSHASPAASQIISHPPEYWEQLHQMAGGKTKDAMTLAYALMRYASDHAGQFPSSLDQVESYLRGRKDAVLTGTNEFEIVYQGSLDLIKNIPTDQVALLRDRQPWLAPSGKMAKVYAMIGGIGEIVESDDNFQGWEAEHIIDTTSGGQATQ
jgi:hypothetical protein